MKTNTTPTVRKQTTEARLTEEEVAAVNGILVEQLDVAPDQLTPAAVIDADLGADSLDKVEIVMKVEERFGVTIADDAAEPVRTVEDLYELVAKMLGR